ncbi:EamA family transporter RarD [Luteimonas sp. Y-2-2-4F]|nr:EamA family transporter RarD [Luteimonas sp. Y-2-2-4F]MCD9032078.1 EamA family transporter RarD [Luteimonas sp. Y-2-2-4F]
MTSPALDRRGLWMAAGAFVLWGVMPLYWHLLASVPALQIVLHRVVWGALLVAGWLFWQRGRGWLRQTLARPRVAAMLAASGCLIAFNWGLYIWAVNSGHVIETSLGYFINPLLNVLIGVAVLRERLNRVQAVSVAIAAAGVLWLTFNYGSFPWIALSLAASFALYGLIRRQAAVDAIPGLGVESLFLLPAALVGLAWLEARGQGGFFGHWPLSVDALLVAGGALTALPLIGFAYGVRRIPFTLVGLLQYIAPTLQLLIGVFFFGEPFGSDRAIGFAIIWAALALFAADGLARARRRTAKAG